MKIIPRRPKVEIVYACMVALAEARRNQHDLLLTHLSRKANVGFQPLKKLLEEARRNNIVEIHRSTKPPRVAIRLTPQGVKIFRYMRELERANFFSA